MEVSCATCSALRLPSVAAFSGRPHISRSIKFESSCLVSTDNVTLPAVTNGIDTASASVRWVSNHGADFCSRCDFCMLVFDALAKRYSAAIGETIQRIRRGADHTSSSNPVQLLLKLSKLTYHPFYGSHDVDGVPTQFKGISFMVVQGTLSFIPDTAALALTPTEPCLDLVLPFELFGGETEFEVNKNLTNGVYRRQLTADVLSDENMKTIKSWLNNCTRQHSKCASAPEGVDCCRLYATSSGEKLFLPTRLIRIGNQLAEEQPRIILSRDEFRNGIVEVDQARYLALSYCWGSSQERLRNLTSNVSNIDDMMSAIPWSDLPQTFQDICLLARTLGINYVWIDSLCILQGDGGDWEKESATMWAVFSNAFITVVTAASSSPHSGFLNRDLSPSCKIQSPKCTECYSLRHRPGTKWWGSDRMAEITGQRWITRGWAYQEERLARRVLMFGRNKFFFDCRERERAEDTDVWLYRPSWSRILYTETSDILQQGEVPASKWYQKIFQHWQWLCTQYSHRVLTIAEDKLPAFSGVAAAVAAKVQTRYLAGLWEANLTHDLLWDTVGNVERSPVYRAPSWSWASLDSGAITWKESRICLTQACTPHCRIIQAYTRLSGPNEFGAITDAHLQLEGHIIGVDLLANVEQYLQGHPWVVLHQEQIIAEAKLDMREPASTSENVSSLWGLLVSTCGNGKGATRGLLLNATGTQEDSLNVFQRVGTFTVPAMTTFELEMKLCFWKNLNPVQFVIK